MITGRDILGSKRLSVTALEGKISKHKYLSDIDKGRIVMARPISKRAVVCFWCAAVIAYQNGSTEGQAANQKPGYRCARLIDTRREHHRTGTAAQTAEIVHSGYKRKANA